MVCRHFAVLSTAETIRDKHHTFRFFPSSSRKCMNWWNNTLRYVWNISFTQTTGRMILKGTNISFIHWDDLQQIQGAALILKSQLICNVFKTKILQPWRKFLVLKVVTFFIMGLILVFYIGSYYFILLGFH